ncbi:hypothetical protein LTR47_010674 [Exophiala xenobiotica]|nr:hypothetical protein LTR41_008192 [Exophiala xenobiotica]KAK5222282.1 hypothetical protein LTR47_010674 [Exophiala xenobiotica]KAK5241615.1 hypothetical protein LTS06_012005 [Exophiala xenobiotica]KAK5259901.1 hypothetical protein LTR40_005116 [Exophiala xenobiotica]KAK5348530.1 hypothetical protein LTR61_007990 [Exophiala xenobiotica]
MVFLVLALGATIYFTVEKIRDHKQKKRASKAQQAQALQYATVERASINDNKAARRSSMELPPPYLQETLPTYRQWNGHITA